MLFLHPLSYASPGISYVAFYQPSLILHLSHTVMSRTGKCRTSTTRHAQHKRVGLVRWHATIYLSLSIRYLCFTEAGQNKTEGMGTVYFNTDPALTTGQATLLFTHPLPHTSPGVSCVALHGLLLFQHLSRTLVHSNIYIYVCVFVRLHAVMYILRAFDACTLPIPDKTKPKAQVLSLPICIPN